MIVNSNDVECLVDCQHTVIGDGGGSNAIIKLWSLSSSLWTLSQILVSPKLPYYEKADTQINFEYK